MASLNSKYLSFTKATGTGVQTVTGVGFQGKALLLWTTYQTASGATTAVLKCLGLTDGILQSCRFIHLPHNEASTTSAQAEQTDHILYKVGATSGATPNVQVAGVFGGFTADGWTMNFTTNDGNADLVHAVVLGGDIEAAFTQIKMTMNSGESIDVEDIGFRPSAFIVMGGAADEFGTGDYNNGAPFGSIHGFGFSNAVENVCGWTLGRGTAGASDNNRGQSTNAVSSVRVANVTGAADTMTARITAKLDDGYTITRDSGDNTKEPVQHVLCLKGVKFTLGSFTAPLTAIPKVVTLPFEPDLVMLQTIGTTATENTSGLGLSIGAWQRADDDSGGTWIGGTDNANPSVYRRSTYEDLVIETRNSSGSAVMQAAVDDTDSTSITFDFSAVSGSADEIIYMALAATETVRGSFVAGEKTTVRGPRAAAFGLDGNTNVHDQEGQFKVFGDVAITGDLTVAGSSPGGGSAFGPQSIRIFVSATATTFNVNSTSYITVIPFAFNIDLDLFPFTHYQLLINGQSNAVGQTVTAQLATFSTPATPIHSGGNDLVIPNTSTQYNSGYLTRDDGSTGLKSYMVVLKGSNSTVDLQATYVEIILKGVSGAQVVVATSSESVTNDTMQDDNELLLNVAANAVYVVELVGFFTTGTATGVDVKVGFTFPASAVMTYAVLGYGGSATTNDVLALDTSALASSSPTTTTRGTISTATSASSPVLLKGVLRTGANAGTLQFQFAQAVTTGGTPLVRAANSLLRLLRVS